MSDQAYPFKIDEKMEVIWLEDDPKHLGSILKESINLVFPVWVKARANLKLIVNLIVLKKTTNQVKVAEVATNCNPIASNRRPSQGLYLGNLPR